MRSGFAFDPPRRLRRRGGSFVSAVFAATTLLAVVPAPSNTTSRNSSARPDEAAGFQGASHARSEGFILAASRDEDARPDPRCPGDAPVRRYDVAAINVDISLNRYLDHDPKGRMYVLEQDLRRVRDEERKNARARDGKGDPAVSSGLQGDAIQPLSLRVHQGECLRVRLRNALRSRETASLHLHGAGLRLGGSLSPAIATNTDAYARPGKSVDYEWWVRPDEPEGTHYFHSHGNDRFQSGHGLFGALIVEPRGSEWLDPRSGKPLRTGWDAIIRPPQGPAFREYVLFYHEIGNEQYQLLDRNGEFVPLVDPLTKAYRPAARALNYRAEPFMNRLQLQERESGRFDESVSYSSYAFGDPATPILRAYLGDPVKQRLVHGGSEVFHVHHVHGGSIRWLRQPSVEDGRFDAGLDKHPPLVPKASERIDSQAVGPSESFDIADECGSGGCQQSVGDFLFHCHVAHHYFAGMWGIWRVYNTLQDGHASTDSLPPLRELPDRAKRVVPAITSTGLIGRTVEWFGKRMEVGDLGAWVERQLPPRGKPKGYDASVLDWSREGNLYLNEPETKSSWPGYHPRAPGERLPITFDPKTGKPAYPFLRPHLGRRPPFAPNHGPAPFLDPVTNGTDPPAPGANGPGSVCPDGTRVKTLNVHAITLPITLNKRAHLTDPAGEIYVLRSEEERVRVDNDRRVPLAVRANAGEDCVDFILSSELEDASDDHGFAKVNAHIHFVQFDVQASDGVITGFNYEQSVRPYKAEGQKVAAPSPVGATSLQLDRTDRFQPGTVVAIGQDTRSSLEIRRIKSIADGALEFDEPLRIAHAVGEIVSMEFVRYRWYPDVQFGTAYFHDHVNAISSWRHGLFGALIGEPPGSTYHDPHTGASVDSGPIADIHTQGRVSADITGSFREFAVFLQDDQPIDAIGRSSGSALNLRAEPLDERTGDSALVFSSRAHGDPETPVLEAYTGDPIVMRTLVSGTNDVHTWHVDGHTFRAEPYSNTSPPVSTIHVGISERYDLSIPSAGGSRRRPGDYLFFDGRSFKLREGTWGLLRVHGRGNSLRPLPGHESVLDALPVCPSGAPRKEFDVVAKDVPLPMLDGERGMVFVLRGDRSKKQPEPLVLHVNVGDCVEVRLSSTTGSPVSFHCDTLAYDPLGTGGVAAGNNPLRVSTPGKPQTFTYYADPQIGETVALVRDGADALRNPALGMYGAIVVGPKGARYRDPNTGRDASRTSATSVDVVLPTGRAYRDFTLFFQDEDAGIGTHKMPYAPAVSGVVGLNYQSAPLPAGAQQRPRVLESMPATPLLRAFVGDPVKMHVLAPSSEQAQVFSVEGHAWPFEPGRAGSDLLSSVQVGALESTTLHLDGGAGGRDGLPGDYLYGDHREPYRDAGLWGMFQVRCPGDGDGLRALPGERRRIGGCGGGRGVPGSLAIGLVAIAAVLAAVATLRRNAKT